MITFPTLGQMVYPALKSLPAEAAWPDSFLGADLAQQEVEWSQDS